MDLQATASASDLSEIEYRKIREIKDLDSRRVLCPEGFQAEAICGIELDLSPQTPSEFKIYRAGSLGVSKILVPGGFGVQRVIRLRQLVASDWFSPPDSFLI